MRKPLSQRKKKKAKSQKRSWVLKKVILVFLLMGLIGLILGLYRFLKSGQLPREGRLTIGFGSNPVIIASVSPEQDSLTFLLIPERTLIESSQGYGEYRIEVFKKLSEVEDKPWLLQESLQAYLGLPIDGWLKKPADLPVQLEEQSLKRWYQKQVFRTFKRAGQPGIEERTNLYPADFLRLWLISLSVKSPNLKVISLDKDQALSEVELADGGRFFAVDLVKTDDLIADYFFEEKIKKEKLTVGVVNATGRAGLAKKAARLATNLGATVIKIADWPEKLSESQIRVGVLKPLSFTANKLAWVFKSDVKQIETDSFLVDVLVVVGEDFWLDLNERE